MATIKVMSAGAVKAMVEAIGAEFAQATGHALDLDFGTAGALRTRLEGGEATDLMCLPPAMIDQLACDGVVAPGARIDLGRTVTGIAVKAGAPLPDISTPAAFRRALLAAKSVAYPDPAAGGSSGIYFRGLLERLGLADVIAAKEILSARGEGVARLVADGQAEIGATFISEIVIVPGTQVVGPLPGDLHNVNTYTGAVAARSKEREAAATLLQALTDPSSRPRWLAAGLEPAF
jgi:molybdate transport system substrate-binding protein